MQHPVLKNTTSGQIIELVKSPFTMGRSLTSDYVIENKIVSRIHCSLGKTDEGWTLTDSSTNGTLVNDGHYKSETSPILKNNDEISLGYDSYTYRFLTEVDKAPNCQIEKLKTREANVQDNIKPANEIVRSPGTPNSFDDNGISDELLNNLADNLLTTVEQQGNAQTKNIPLENSEQHTTSRNSGTSFQTEKEEEISEATSKCVIGTSGSSEPFNNAINLLNAQEKNQGPTEGTNLIATEQLGSKNEESDKQNNYFDLTSQSSSNSSINTIIYTLPDESLAEMPVNNNREEQTSNMNVEQNEDSGIIQVHTGSVGATVENINVGGSTTSASKPRDVQQDKNTEAIQVCTGSMEPTATVENITASGPSTSASKRLDLLAESIEAVVRKYAEDTTNAILSTSVTVASPINANKKVKVMAVSPGVINQLRPLSSVELSTMIATGQFVKRITQDEMKRILARHQGVPMIVSDQQSTNSSSVRTNTTGTGYQQGTNTGRSTDCRNGRSGITTVTTTTTSTGRPAVSRNRGGITTVTTRTSISTASGSCPGKVPVLRGIRKVHNNSLPAPSTSSIAGNILTAVNPSISTTSILNDGINGGHIAPAVNPMIDTISILNKMINRGHISTADNPSISTTSILNNMINSGHITTAANPSISTTSIHNDMINSITVPDAVSEVVIENTVETTDAASTCTNQNTIKCHDSQEPGPSRASEKVVDDRNKKIIQNHYEEMENELMCTICANLFIKAVTLGCSHSFCQYCIGEWKKKKTDCPICRNKITSTTRTLVLDNIIEKMLETASNEDKEDRNAAIEERKKIEDEEIAKKNKQNRGTSTARRGRPLNPRSTRRNNSGNNAGPPPPVITIADSPATTDNDDSDNSSDNNSDDYDYDDYYSDDWYNGRPGAYYGGYGRCYKCGEQGHWSNGCPYR